MVWKLKTLALTALLTGVVIMAPGISAEVEDRSDGRSERMAAYREKQTEKLAEAQANRLASRCVAAQKKVTTLRARVQRFSSSRQEIYQDIGEKLDTLLVKLQAGGVDTVRLETAREDMQVDLASLSKNLGSYDTVLADLEVMDCAADPDGFQAVLFAARETQTQLRAQTQEFRQFVTTQLSTILKDLRQQVSNTSAQEDSLAEPTTGDQ